MAGYISHSNRKASIGSKWTALRAGKYPKSIPTSPEKVKAINIMTGFKTNGIPKTRQDTETIIALQILTRMTGGSPSFRDMSPNGGDMIMRGYYEGRFRDNNAVQFQAELRQLLIGLFGITLFSVFGNVWKKFRYTS